MKEVIPSPSASDKSDPLDSPKPHLDVLKKLNSSGQIAGTKHRPRPSFGVRTVSGRYNISTFVQEQHITIRERCRHELGAEVSPHLFDTEYAGLIAWIKSERLTRLPHKGGAWDRVLSAAQYFAEQVQTLHSTSQEFTAGSGAAANLVFGQCLLLLEVRIGNFRDNNNNLLTNL